MNDNFENQKERLVSIKQEISLLQQQVNYLLRNEKPLGLLDLDVLMNRTHTVYDLLCSINLGETESDEDVDIDPEAFSGLFAPMMQVKEDEVEEEPPLQEELVEPIDVEMHVEEEVPVSTLEEIPQEEVMEEEVEEERKEALVEEMPEDVVPQSIEDEHNEVNPKPEEKSESDEFGLFFRFEDVPAQKDEKPEEIISVVERSDVEETTSVERTTDVDDRVVHFVDEIPEDEIPERDLVDGENLVRDNPFEMPKMEHGNIESTVASTGAWDMKPEEIEHSEPSEYEDVFKRDDTEFEMATSETLGERMMGEDHSLAAKLQQTPGRDLKSVIGINDKFLFVNELFGGSMEKYNKSIENLNDLKTLNGAMIYLNELKIELQWNSSNEAYLKLKDLVSRKFEE